MQDPTISFDAFHHRNERDEHNDTQQTHQRTPNDLLPYKAHTQADPKHQSGNNSINDTKNFYKTYFKLCYDDKHLISIYDTRRARQEHIDSNIKYHIEFFRNGLNAIIKLWLAGGCQESPEEMAQVLKEEYRGR